MTFSKTLLIATASTLLTLGAASASFAQESMTDKAKDAAIDQGEKMAKDKAAKEMSGMTGDMADKGIEAGADMAKGKSAKDAAMDAAMKSGKDEAKGMMSTDMSADEMETAGKVMIKGGSAEDAAMEVGKKRMKDKAKDVAWEKADGMMKKDKMHKGDHAMKEDGMMEMETAPAAATTVIVNCPSGTTAQPDGTCMITGDFEPKS